MKHQDPHPLRRLLVVLGAAVGWGVLTIGLGWATSEAWAAIRRPGPAALDDTLTVVAAAGAWIALTWLAAGVVLVALSGARGRLGAWTDRAAAAITPYAVRRATAAALGLSLVAGPAAAASVPAAAPAGAARITASAPLGVAPAPHERAVPDPLPLLDRPTGPERGAAEGVVAAGSEGQAPAAGSSTGAWLPERPVALGPPTGREQAAAATRLVVGEARPDREPHREPHDARTAERVVHRGDTLWSIAAADLAARLGRRPTDAETALQWPRWYAANAHVIGADPGRLLPGQVLHAPDAPVHRAIARPTLD